jgi:hypothetical protein
MATQRPVLTALNCFNYSEAFQIMSLNAWVNRVFGFAFELFDVFV